MNRKRFSLFSFGDPDNSPVYVRRRLFQVLIMHLRLLFRIKRSDLSTGFSTQIRSSYIWRSRYRGRDFRITYWMGSMDGNHLVWSIVSTTISIPGFVHSIRLLCSNAIVIFRGLEISTTIALHTSRTLCTVTVAQVEKGPYYSRTSTKPHRLDL